ncbi:TPA: hypothetical protein IUW29_001419 [Enterococcus faecalis]|uniref:hypothetical protein n=1 Tax=Enterococcus TaxID=1350 RepID=UPI00142FD28A|nr:MULTISPECIES: hypothetical protein [Enterococcus]EGO5849087.1 hypothetical protein [Enterococcus faecalis]MDQ8608387.1 hypothetical protein [Enterococcus sp. FR133]NJJ99552.1 hypothetical protein [Enterococcus faecalis]HAP4476084.1 hypothetical protein [Enterococcus faecalis]HAP4496523.1 hypothetical protein [Enterococcus faecalis]
MKCYLSNITNKEKPDQYKVKKIANTILNNLREITIQEFAEELSVNGKTVVLAELSENKLSKMTKIIGQELVMLDFDNKDENNLYTIEDLEADSFMQENASFIYRTFSDLFSEVDKFRVVFHLDKLVTENQEIEQIYQDLFKKYPQADSSVGQTSRLFFGSNSGYEVIDWDNRLDTTKLAEIRHTDISKEVKPISGEMIDDSIPNYELLRLGRLDIVAEKLGDSFSGEFSDPIVAGNFFKTIDMVELLELPDTNPFLDIFHEETNSSASVYLNEEYDIYLYKCFSEQSRFQGDIIRVIRKLLNIKSYTKVIEVLVTITNSEINWKSEIGEARYNAMELQKALKRNTLRLNYPDLNKYLYNYRQEIDLLLDLIFDYTYMDKETREVKYMNFISLKTYAKLVKENLGYKISEGKMWNILNVVTVTELIRKAELKSIPLDLKEKLILNQQENSEQIRTSNVYYPVVDIENSQILAKEMAQNNVTISGLGYNLVYRLFGEEKANQDFPQAYKPLEDRGLVSMSKRDRNLTKASVALEKSAVKILMTQIEEQGYMYESDLISKLARVRKTKKSITQNNFQKIRADIYNNYGIKRERLTKELYYELEMKEKYSPKVVLYK